MTDEPGRLIAAGRAADVFDRGDGTVLRRYRIDRDTPLEARAMSWLGSQGIAVPRVERAAGRDLVMERITGVTMLADLEAHPWRLRRDGRTLASLQRHLNALTAPSWFPRRPGVPEGDSVLHLDLHPMNVMLGPGGPWIIDWTNVSSGPAPFDAAMSFAVMASFQTSGLRDRLAQQVLVQVFAASRGRAVISSALRDACSLRLTDPNVTSVERAALERMRARSRSVP